MTMDEYTDNGYEYVADNGMANQAALNTPDGRAVTVDLATECDWDIEPEGAEFEGDADEGLFRVIDGRWVKVQPPIKTGGLLM